MMRVSVSCVVMFMTSNTAASSRSSRYTGSSHFYSLPGYKRKSFLTNDVIRDTMLSTNSISLNSSSSPSSLFNKPTAVKDIKEGEYIPSLLSIRGGGGGYTKNAVSKVQHQQHQQSHENKSSLSSIFPIAKNELPKFLSLSIMMFFFIYIFTTARDTKDTLVVSNCGAEAIPFLKLYGVMPCAFLFIIAYTRLSQIVGKESLFYMTLIPFFLFYGIFAFVLFPNRDVIHFLKDVNADGGTTLGSSRGVVGTAVYSLIQNWTYSLYYIVTELWASAGVPLLFWQVANDITPLHQAKTFYPLFAVIGNLAPIVSGKVMAYFISNQKSADDIGFQSTLQKLATVKIGICFGILALYNLLYKMKDNDRRVVNNDDESSIKSNKGKRTKMETKSTTTKKEKMTLSESMRELFKSKELKAMATMVFCYNSCVELTEVLWKGILKKSYPNKTEYMAFMAKFSQSVGIIALMLQLSASTIMTKFGWLCAASLTPLAMVAFAIPFFVSVALSGNSSQSKQTISLATALTIGTWQSIVSKVTKYSLFDPCKEMAYIPLGADAKTKGKAAVDVLGARMGRSAGSATQQILVSYVVGSGSILSCAPMIGVVYLITVGYWINAVHVLGLKMAQTFQTIDKE